MSLKKALNTSVRSSAKLVNRRYASRIGPTSIVLTIQETCNPPRQAANCTLFSFITCTTRSGYNQSCGRDTTTNLKGRQKSRRLLRAVSSTLARATRVSRSESDPDRSAMSFQEHLEIWSKLLCLYSIFFLQECHFWRCHTWHTYLTFKFISFLFFTFWLQIISIYWWTSDNTPFFKCYINVIIRVTFISRFSIPLVIILLSNLEWIFCQRNLPSFSANIRLTFSFGYLDDQRSN